MKKFISCDWGTSSFRLRLVQSSDLSILATRTTGQGIAATYALWEESKTDRLSFYQSILGEAIAAIAQESGISLESLPLVVSGMASSSLGMLELPYKQFPFFTDGSDLRVEQLKANGSFTHDVLLISGASTDNDVMRGEETQLVGCDIDPDEEGIFIFPGTHSKHVTVRKGRAIGLKTYMTGEFFELLSKKSILAGSVEGPVSARVAEAVVNAATTRGEGSLSGDRLSRFEEGVRSGVDHNLLHAAFLVRTNRLLKGVSKEENYYYLSGLLIGAELKELAGTLAPLTIVGSASQKDNYNMALRVLGLDGARFKDAGEAVLRGQVLLIGE